ncbi:MAG: MarC family protein [Phycisphaerales bacterium]
MRNFLLAFIPLFVAVDSLGLMPVFFGLTEGMDRKEKNKIIMQSAVTASIVAVIFILIGRMIFKFLGITIEDFMIAGGVILFCISITDMISTEKVRKLSAESLGSVPLGIPLMVGPAVLTTCLILVPQFGMKMTILCILLNILIAALVLQQSHHLIKILGVTGSKAFSKVMSLLLASIGIMLIRKGIEAFIK